MSIVHSYSVLLCFFHYHLTPLCPSAPTPCNRGSVVHVQGPFSFRLIPPPLHLSPVAVILFLPIVLLFIFFTLFLLLTLVQMSPFPPAYAHLHPAPAHFPLAITLVCVYVLCIHVLWLIPSPSFIRPAPPPPL